MKTRPSTDIFRYWQTLRQGSDVPSRDQIDPGALRHILADLFILEADGAAAPRFRLAGTRICSLFVRELRGTRFDGLWSASDMARLSRIARTVLAGGAPMLVQASGITANGDRLDVEIALLPLRSTAGASSNGPADRIFGSMSPLSSPSWIGAHPLPYLTLGDVAHLEASAETVSPAEPLPARTVVARSYPSVSSGSPLRQAMQRVMHLSVLDGGREHR
jgi:hypothetical protein